MVWDGRLLPDDVSVERTSAGFLRLVGGEWDGRTFDDIDSVLAFIDNIEAGRAASGSRTDRSPFERDAVYTVREIARGSTGYDVQSGTAKSNGDDDGLDAPTLYPAQTCGVCQDAATWAHALSQLSPPVPAGWSGPNELSLWAMCDRCERLFSEQSLDALVDVYTVAFDVGHAPGLVEKFLVSLAQAELRTMSVHRIAG